MQIINSGPRSGLLEGNTPGRSVNSSQLERWMGAEKLEHVSQLMKDWYGPPIALGGVPGKVFVHRGGDFRGELRAGFEASALDYAFDLGKRFKRGLRRASKSQALKLNAGFSSLSDLISEASTGKRREFTFQKVGTTGVVAATNTLWFVGNQPAAGAAASAAPGGIAPTDATTGAFLFDNPTGGDTTHFVYGWASASVIANTLLLYDRLFSVTKTMSSTGTEAVTGVPTRYQSTTTTAMDYIGGNFLMIECRTALSATAHNWTTCLYTDQGGTGSNTLPSVTGNSSNIINRLDQPASTWFCPLATGDTGIKELDQMQCSASVTGAIDFTIGRPLVWMPCPVANIACGVDGINTAFNLVRIFDDACLAFLEMTKPATTATTYVGGFTTVAG